MPSYYPLAGNTSHIAQTGLPRPAYPYSDITVTGPSDQTVRHGSQGLITITAVGGTAKTDTEPYTYNYFYIWHVYSSKTEADNDADGTAGTVVSDGGFYNGATTNTLTVTDNTCATMRRTTWEQATAPTTCKLRSEPQV